MKQKLMVFFMLLTSAAGVSAGVLSLRVVPITGQAQQEVLSAIGKVVYRNDSLLVVDHANYPLYKEALQNLRRIDFTNAETPETAVSSPQDGTAHLSVYPNPTQGLLQVQNAEGDKVRVYNTQGKLLITKNLRDSSATIDVSALPIGTYLLLVQNGVFRFIKE